MPPRILITPEKPSAAWGRDLSRQTRIPFYRNPAYRGVAAQIAVLAFVVWAFYTIFTNTVENLNERGIQTGFGFLTEIAPFSIGFSPFIDFELSETT